MDSASSQCTAVEVRDRFGDYGLVGVAFWRAYDDALVVEGLMMSCRALGRGVEHRLISHIGGEAIARGLTSVRIPYVRTQKNLPMLRFLESLDARVQEESDRLTFAISSERAAQLVFLPDGNSDLTYGAEEGGSGLATNDVSRERKIACDVWQEVAEHLSSVDSLLIRIDEKRQGARPTVGAAFVPPQSDIERRLAGQWASILGLDRVGIHDDFFELGGTSVQATLLVNLLQQDLQREFPLAMFFESPSVAGMAAAVEGLQSKIEARRATEGAPTASDADGERETVLPPIVPAPQDKHLPFRLTDVQQAYWAGRSGAFSLGNVSCHVYTEYECAELDLARLNRAWQRLIGRHDMLRAIVLPDGQQQILEQVPPYTIQALDLRGQDAQAIASQLEAIREQLSHQVLKSDRWPLFEIRVSRIEERLYRLHFSRDVLMIDGWSASILHRELCQLYQQPDAELPPLEISFRDYVLAEAAIRETDLYQRSRDYWWNRLAALPPAPELPLAKDPSLVARPRFTRRRARLEPIVWSSLKSRSGR